MNPTPEQQPRQRDPRQRSLPPQWILRPSAGFGGAGALERATPLPVPPTRPPRLPSRSKQQLSRGAAICSAWIGLLGAIALPVLVWHDTVVAVAGRFRFDVGYLVTGWSGYLLLFVGLALMLPVALSTGRPEPRILRSRRAYFTWGIVLYLLGLALSSQVAALAG